MDIDSRTQRSLEFELIQNSLKSLCLAQETPDLLASQPFYTDEKKLTRIHQQVDELLRLYLAEGDPHYRFPEIFPILERLRPENSILQPIELYSLATFFVQSGQLRSYLTQERELFSTGEVLFLHQLFQQPEFDGAQVLKTFDSEGNLLENHPDVLQMSRERRSLNVEIKEMSSRFFSNNKEFMQEDRPVIRGGRLLLPLKSNFRGRVKGIIHEVSASGNTLFIETVDFIDVNNKMVELDNRLKQIQLKWMKSFSNQFRENLENLKEIHERLLKWDILSAKARYARLYHCTRPTFSPNFNLNRSIHPALKEKAIPVDFRFDETNKIVVISGPNAGGKTVLLKTVALAVMMNQFGMFIHGGENSTLPLFSRLICTIGDNQSIQEGVSTFSGYMRRVKEILTVATPTTLILLDELGSGTDPAEGSVLGVAILEAIEKKRATALITTHHKDIRNYAQTTSSAINAAVQFDEKKNSPTYQIKVGTPGASRAIDIAASSGLPSSLIESARRLLQKNRSESLILMDKLTQKERELDEKTIEITEKQARVRERIREVDLKDLKLKQKELELKKEKQREINQFLQTSRKELDKLIEELAILKKKYENSTSEKHPITQETTPSETVKTFFEKINSKVNADKEQIDKIQEEVAQRTGYQFYPGMKVLVGEFKRKGEILRKDNKKGWIISTESIKISISESDLIPDTQGEAEKKSGQRKPSFEFIRESSGSKPELVMDLRGCTLQEAKEQLYKQIELALVHQLEQFSIIHGLGNGVLQQGIRKELREISSVTDFYYARPEFGGNGRTEVRLG